MQYEVTFAGFGGQGIMMIGQVLAIAGLEEGKNVVWLPSYGPEMRGGTAFCTVVISDKPIGSPIISFPQCAAVFNRPSFDKFSPRVKKGGLLIINSSMIDVKSDRTDMNQILVPANDLAIQFENPKASNMAILGAFMERSKVISIQKVKDALTKKFGNKEKALATSLKVFEAGRKLGEKS